MQSAGVTVNGRWMALHGPASHTTALEWLRDRGLVGCKEGCAEGECGACAILVARPGLASPTEWTALNACLVPIAALGGQELVTAEGLGRPTALHPVQRELAVRGGSQCGYCTPGFVCSMAAEYYRSDRRPAEASAQAADPLLGTNGFDLHALSGNLCRCTGYRPIRDAAFALGEPAADDPLAIRRNDPPPDVAAGWISDSGTEFVRPTDLADTLALLAARPEAAVVAGCTDWGVDVNLRGLRAPLVVAIDRIPELRGFRVDPAFIEIGAALTLSEVETLLGGRIPLLEQLLPQFASRLIRNGATLGGNLGTGSPIGDAAPCLLALDADVVLSSVDGEREVPLSGYFVGYRRSVRRPGELIRAVRVPLPLAGTAAFHKLAKRRFDDISSVAIAFALSIEDGVVRRARIGLGGVAATPLRARATEEALVDQPWQADTVLAAAQVLAAEGTPLDDHRGSAAYRSAMLGQSLLKFFAEHPTTGRMVEA